MSLALTVLFVWCQKIEPRPHSITELDLQPSNPHFMKESRAWWSLVILVLKQLRQRILSWVNPAWNYRVIPGQRALVRP